ncbi:retrovirus-related pol polyprotein from transposon TNT 1-94, partial [Tanacetum coccineum]
MILESVENGPLIWPTIEENGVTRPKKYSELSATEAIQADCDVKATNIILQGLPPEVYALVSNHRIAKELWERIQLLMQGTSLTKQERECKLYDEFDKFAYKKGETLRDFYLRFSLLLNDMNIYNVKLEQFQVNTKFLNTLPPEWSKFVTDVKLFQKGDDPIDAINHMMSFLTAVVTSPYPTTNNQLRNSSNPRQQAIINDGRVTLQLIHGRKLLLLRVLQGHALQEQVEAILGNKGLLFVTTAKGKATCSNSALNLRGNRIIHGLRIKCCWYKLKQVVKFYMRKNSHFWQIQELQKVKPHRLSLPTMLLIKPMIWMHITGDRSQLTNFVNKFLGTVKFGNDHIAKIMRYGDYQIGNVTISRVYYVEGLGHNLFFVGQFCDSNLEVAFHQHTCYIRNLEGVDLLTGSRVNNLYTLSLRDMMASSPICLLSKASKTKSWLWHRCLSHLNFGTINHLARHDLVRGLPKLKFEKDHLCSACAMGKSKKKPHKPKSEDTNKEKLYLLHMDLCGPIHVASVNGKKYILVIVDDYSRFTWVKCLRSKDEALDFIIKFLTMIQVRLKVHVQRIRTYNGTEFVNQTLREYYEKVDISYETSVARSPHQNCVVQRRNRTLIEAAHTMLIYAKALLFL